MSAIRRLGTTAGALLCLAACVAATCAHGQVIHREPSLYQTVLVTERGATVCLQFEARSDVRNQSCVDRRRPRRLVLPYTRMLLGSLLLIPDPETILVVGLGGGVLPKAFAELLPDARIDVVEIDPVVVAVAERFFGFAPRTACACSSPTHGCSRAGRTVAKPGTTWSCSTPSAASTSPNT